MVLIIYYCPVNVFLGDNIDIKGFYAKRKGARLDGWGVVHVQWGPFDDRNGDRQKPILPTEICIKKVPLTETVMLTVPINEAVFYFIIIFIFIFNFFFVSRIGNVRDELVLLMK